MIIFRFKSPKNHFYKFLEDKHILFKVKLMSNMKILHIKALIPLIIIVKRNHYTHINKILAAFGKFRPTGSRTRDPRIDCEVSSRM